jgi:hypothetical protein
VNERLDRINHLKPHCCSANYPASTPSKDRRMW